MSKTRHRRADPDLRDEYDFSQGERGKHARRFADGSNVVVLDPDVAKRFANSASVNAALRSLFRRRRTKRSKARPNQPEQPTRPKRRAAERQ
ncbi:MAG TPA: hypothetical protein VF384_16415 [Planctomycetota bacterium]